MTATTKSLDDYLSFSYPYELFPEEEGMFFAEHPDLPGCLAQGDTADEAVAHLDEARKAWIGFRFEMGLPIPECRLRRLSGARRLPGTGR